MATTCAGSTFPAALVEAPAVAVLTPARRRVVMVAASHAFPVALYPDVAIAIPGPVTRRPDETAAWRRHAFITWRRWRRANADIHRAAYLRLRHRRHQYRRCGAGAQQDGQDDVLVVHDLLPYFEMSSVPSNRSITVDQLKCTDCNFVYQWVAPFAKWQSPVITSPSEHCQKYATATALSCPECSPGLVRVAAHMRR